MKRVTRQTLISNCIDDLQKDLHLQWTGSEAEGGIVLVGRLRNGEFVAYYADGFTKKRFRADGLDLNPALCQHCGCVIVQNPDDTWTHEREPHHHHPATPEEK